MSHAIVILINNREYRASAPELSGREIKQLAAAAGVTPEYELMLEHEPGTGKPEERAIRDDERVQLRNGMRFAAIPPGNRGSSWS